MSIADISRPDAPPDRDRDVPRHEPVATHRPRPLVHLVAVIAVAGLALRVAWWLLAQPTPVADYLGYRSLAERLLDDGTFIRDGVPTAWRVPGYPAFLAAGMAISRSDQWLSVLNVVLSASVVPLTGLVAHRLGLPRRSVLAATGAAAILPPLVLWAPVLGSENLQLPLVLGALALALDRRPAVWPRIACGVLLGLAVLVRPESLVVIATIPVVIWTTGTTPRRALLGGVVVAVVAAGVVAPWYVRNEVVVDRGVGLSSTGGMNFYLAHRADGYGFVDPEATPLRGLAEGELADTGYRLGMEHLADEPTSLLGDVAQGTTALYGPPSYAAHYSTRHTGRYPFPASVGDGVVDGARAYAVVGWSVLAVVGVVGLVRLRRRPRVLLALGTLVFLNWFCFAVVFWAMPRYRLTIEPLLCLAIGAAVWPLAPLAPLVPLHPKFDA